MPKRNTEIKPEDIPKRGRKLKLKIPKFLKPTKSYDQKKNNVGFWEKVGYGIKKIFGFVSEAAHTVKEAVTVTRQLKIILWLALAVSVVVLLIKIL